MLKTPEKEVMLKEAMIDFLDSISKDKFFGIVEFHFQDGKLVRIKKHEVLEPKDLIDGCIN